MTENQDSYRNFFYAEGPQGQRVVVVHPGVQPIGKSPGHKCYICCIFMGIVWAVVSLFLAITYVSIEVGLRAQGSGLYPLFIAGCVCFGVAGMFVVLTTACYCCLQKKKSVRIQKYMHHDNYNSGRTPEEEEREEFSFGLLEVPEIERSLTHGHQSYHPTNYGRQTWESVGSGHSSRASHHFLPSQGNDSYNQNLGRGSPSYQLFTQGNASPSLQHNRQSPRHSNHPSPYGSLQYPGRATPSRSSPVLEGSFSPSSDSTYFSHSSRTDVPLEYRTPYGH